MNEDSVEAVTFGRRDASGSGGEGRGSRDRARMREMDSAPRWMRGSGVRRVCVCVRVEGADEGRGGTCTYVFIWSSIDEKKDFLGSGGAAEACSML